MKIMIDKIIFLCFVGHNKKYAKDPFFKRLILFYEYFNGDTGKGCGAR